MSLETLEGEIWSRNETAIKNRQKNGAEQKVSNISCNGFWESSTAELSEI